MTLEEFIIANHDKTLRYDGSSTQFRYEHYVTVSIRSYDGRIFEATVAYPAPRFCFGLRFDTRQVRKPGEGDLTLIWRWLRDVFFPEVEQLMKKKILADAKKTVDNGPGMP